MFHTKNILNRMMRLTLLASMGFAALLSLAQTDAALAATAPDLGSTSTYGVVSSTLTNTAAGTTINGDVCYTTGPAWPPTINGTTGACPAAAGGDQLAALADLNGQPCTPLPPGVALDAVIIPPSILPGVFPPGCYFRAGALDITVNTTVTLNGAGVYIFRSTGGALTTGANSQVILAGGACASDVFWAPVGGTTLGANAAPSLTPTFVGNILDAAGITLGHFANLEGRALAFGGTVTTDANTITVPTCAPFVPTPPVIGKAFFPTTINAGGVSTLTFTLSNANAAAVTNVSFTDTYPPDLFNAIPPNVVNTCGGTVQGGVGGGNTIGLSGVTIPGTSSCTISVNVTSALVNCYNNVSGVINSDQGAGNSASATLCVTAVQPTAVPTLNEWGVIIFMVLVGLMSIYYLRRQKAKA